MTIELYPDMNTFQYLLGPCLVCGRMPPGTAHGITPHQAVCDTCWVDEPEDAAVALAKAQGIEAEEAEEADEPVRPSRKRSAQPKAKTVEPPADEADNEF